MARPDIRNERRVQILDAFEVCVARYGVEGATLAKTAEIAGLARPLVRHNVGNRSELLDALVDRFLKRSRQTTDLMLEALPAKEKSRTVVSWLFDPAYSDPKLVQVSNALIAASVDDPELAGKMRAWLDDFMSAVQKCLAVDFPHADAEHLSSVAAGISGIYFNVEALYPLGQIEALAASSKQAAMLLLASLEADR